MRQITYGQAINEAFDEEMQRDPSVFLIGEDIGPYGGVRSLQKGLLEKYGEMRVRQTPISESGFVGLSVGAALAGLRPVVELMYVDFVTVAMDQVVNQMAKLSLMSGKVMKMPMVVRAPQGAGGREAAQHSQSLEAWFVHTPGLKVIAPSTPYDMKGLLKSAIRDDEPVICIEHGYLYAMKEDVPEGEWLVPIGEGIVRREGTDITIVATSYYVHKALAAAEKLAAEGISAEVIDPRTLWPLDIDLIVSSVKKTGKLLVVQEATAVAGVAAEIVRQVVERAFYSLDAPPRALGGAHIPMPYSPPLEDVCLTSVEDIAAAVRQMVVTTTELDTVEVKQIEGFHRCPRDLCTEKL